MIDRLIQIQTFALAHEAFWLWGKLSTEQGSMEGSWLKSTCKVLRDWNILATTIMY